MFNPYQEQECMGFTFVSMVKMEVWACWNHLFADVSSLPKWNPK